MPTIALISSRVTICTHTYIIIDYMNGKITVYIYINIGNQLLYCLYTRGIDRHYFFVRRGYFRIISRKYGDYIDDETHD